MALWLSGLLFSLLDFPGWREDAMLAKEYVLLFPVFQMWSFNVSISHFSSSDLSVFFFFNSLESSRFCEVYCQGCILLLRPLCSCDIYFPPISHLSLFLRTRHLIFSFFICFHFYLPTLSDIYFFSAVLTTIFDCVLFYTIFQFPFMT